MQVKFTSDSSGTYSGFVGRWEVGRSLHPLGLDSGSLLLGIGRTGLCIACAVLGGAVVITAIMMRLFAAKQPPKLWLETWAVYGAVGCLMIGISTATDNAPLAGLLEGSGLGSLVHVTVMAWYIFFLDAQGPGRRAQCAHAPQAQLNDWARMPTKNVVVN